MDDELDPPATPEELEKLPSIPLAYELSVDSYETVTKRIDGVDGRIQSIVALSITVMALSPAIATAKHLGFSSKWFWLAASASFASLLVGTIARQTGKLYVLDPAQFQK